MVAGSFQEPDLQNMRVHPPANLQRNKEITYILSPVDGELSKYTYKDKYET
jgi:hypothetical protein